jgi:hypothetical protein
MAEPTVEQEVVPHGPGDDGPSVRHPAEPAAGVADPSPPPAGPGAAVAVAPDSGAVPSDQTTAGRPLVDATEVAPEEGCPEQKAQACLRIKLEAIYGQGRAGGGPAGAASVTVARCQPPDPADPAQGGSGRGPP